MGVVIVGGLMLVDVGGETALATTNTLQHRS
jgi:hypothetical protein